MTLFLICNHMRTILFSNDKGVIVLGIEKGVIVLGVDKAVSNKKLKLRSVIINAKLLILTT